MKFQGFKAVAIGLPGAVAAIALVLHGPIPQDPKYFQFADERVFLGIPRFGDVVSNAAFLIVGTIGLGFLLLRRKGSLNTASERWPYAAVFAGTILTGVGSTWFHLAPDSDRLFWDRLPMAPVFLSLFTIVLSERIGPQVGIRLWIPLMILGLGSVLYWRFLDDDLRLYALIQFYPMGAIPLLLLFYPARYTHASWFWIMFLMYGMAKGCEWLDRPIYEALRGVSGHSLKHALAALSVLCPVWMLSRRRPI